MHLELAYQTGSEVCRLTRQAKRRERKTDCVFRKKRTDRGRGLKTKPQIHLINEDNFTAAIVREDKPVLLVCMPRDDQYERQMGIVAETVSGCVNPPKIGLLEESFIGPFRTRYRVAGTPTFLILQKGVEKNRLLGLADERTLRGFIETACPQRFEG